jgi:LysR family transcriptional regulator, glycine cleavage system transcriptional activator
MLTARRLPFLNGIKAFEAAARTGSFANAAEELHVTPAAVSRMVQLLEARLGVPLFERKANRLAPTTAGRAYQAGLTSLFDQLAALTAQVTAMTDTRVLTVGVGPTFAVRWLIPRLADFQKRQREVEVRFVTGGATVPFNDEWTCGIRLGDGQWPNFVVERLFPANLIPVCSPALAKALRTPEDLRKATLLRVAHADDDWTRWSIAAGIGGLRATGPEFEYYGQALQAAADGVGVAMGIRPYLDDDLRAGRLVAPFAQTASKDAQWYLVYREARQSEPAFSAFRAWIMNAARDTKTATPGPFGRPINGTGQSKSRRAHRAQSRNPSRSTRRRRSAT